MPNVSRHPIRVGGGLTVLVWVGAIAAGVAAPSVAVERATGLGSLGVLVLSSAAFGVPGACLAGWLTDTDSRIGQFVRGYAASAGGGILAIVLVFLVFQYGRGIGPALDAGAPGATLYSFFVFGLIGLALGIVVLLASILAAPFALLGGWLRNGLA